MKRLLLFLIPMLMLLSGCSDLLDTLGLEKQKDPVPHEYVIDGDPAERFITADLPQLRVNVAVTRAEDIVADSIVADITECRDRKEDPCPDITSHDGLVRLYAERKEGANRVYIVKRATLIYERTELHSPLEDTPQLALLALVLPAFIWPRRWSIKARESHTYS